MPKNPVSHVLLCSWVAYLLGVIVGDGTVYGGNKSSSSTARHYRVSVYSNNREWLGRVCDVYEHIRDVHPALSFSSRLVSMPAKNHYAVHVVDKSWHYHVVGEGIPVGKKSACVGVPVRVVQRPELHLLFLSGYFDSDGGVSGRTIGWTSASRELLADVQWMLSEQGVHSRLTSFTHSYNQKEYFVLRVERAQASKFLKSLCLLNTQRRRKCFSHLRMCRSGQTGRL